MRGNRKTELADAIQMGDIQHHKKPLKKGVDIVERSPLGEAPIHIATQKGVLAVITLFLKASENIDERVARWPHTFAYRCITWPTVCR